jgi:acetyl esterase
MTRSLPGVQAPSVGPPACGAAAAPRGKSRATDVVVNAVTRAGLGVIPRIPDSLKLLLLGRSITVDGNTLDTTLQLMFAAQRATGASGLVASHDPAVARAQLRALAGMLDIDIEVGVSDLSIDGAAGPIPSRHYRPRDAGFEVAGPAAPIPSRHYRPRDAGFEVAGPAAPAPLLVFYHGGGFVIGDLDTHDGLCRLIARDAGVHVLSVGYRLAPEHKAPAAVEDASAAYRWATDHAAELGADPGRVAVGGDSAGGNLATLVCHLARDAGVTLPALQLLIYPVTNLRGETRSQTLFAEGYFLAKRDMDWFMDNYLSGAEVEGTDPRLSPLLAGDLSGLPPALVLTAGFDPLRDEGNQYAAAMRAAGTTVDHRQMGSLTHGFINFFPLGGGSATATAQMISALRAHLSHS